MKAARTDEQAPDGVGASLGAVLALGALFTVGAFALFSTRAGLSVLAGAALAGGNLYVLGRVVGALLTPSSPEGADKTGASPAEGEGEAKDQAEGDAEPARPSPPKTFSAAWAGLGVVKMLVLFGGIWVLLSRGLVDPISLVVGYGSLPLGVALRGLTSQLRPPRR